MCHDRGADQHRAAAVVAESVMARHFGRAQRAEPRPSGLPPEAAFDRNSARRRYPRRRRVRATPPVASRGPDSPWADHDSPTPMAACRSATRTRRVGSAEATSAQSSNAMITTSK